MCLRWQRTCFFILSTIEARVEDTTLLVERRPSSRDAFVVLQIFVLLLPENTVPFFVLQVSVSDFYSIFIPVISDFSFRGAVSCKRYTPKQPWNLCRYFRYGGVGQAPVMTCLGNPTYSARWPSYHASEKWRTRPMSVSCGSLLFLVLIIEGRIW